MLERKVYSKLLEWKKSGRKCLLIKGQRQIGKTFIVEAFAESEYDSYLKIDFNETPQYKSLFEGDISVPELIRRLTITFGSESVREGSTLLFLDEIQECPRAYSSLKAFSAYGKLDVIASGSMLGVALRKDDRKRKDEGTADFAGTLIPLGYEEILDMYPMDFEEFLWANGMSKDAVSEIRTCIRERRPLEQFLFAKVSELFRYYMIVGGMPEAVNSFVTTKDFRPVNAVQKELVGTCLFDINRYNEGIDRIKTQECFESIPRQLSETNRKFMYSRISGEGSRRSSDRYRENLLWIKDAGYGNYCYALEQPALPLKDSIKKDVFKVYLSDTGMLLQMYGDKVRMAVYSDDPKYNLGGIYENVVAECLMKCSRQPMYYRKDKGPDKMELDFVQEFWDGLTVIEVKSGEDKISASLKKSADKFDVARRIMLESENIFVDDEGVEHYPIFAAAFIDEMDPQPEGPMFS